MKLKSWLIIFLPLIAFNAQAQLGAVKEKFTRADTLRGSNTSTFRTCYDMNYYHLDVKFDIPDKSICGSVLCKFTATREYKKQQFDLYCTLNTQKALYK